MKAIIKALLLKGLVQFGINSAAKSKAPRYLLLKALAGLLILVAVIFALIAGHQILRQQFNAPMTNLIFAGGFLIAAALIWLTVAIKRQQHKQRSALDTPIRALEGLGEQAQEQAKYIGRRAEGLIRRNTGTILGTVALAAFIMGRRK